MSLRPRFAGDGRLRLPASVVIRRADGEDWHAGDVEGQHGGSTWDPFERTADGLLLAEAFARADLDQPRRARRWFLEHGVLDVVGFFPENLEGRGRDPDDEDFVDTVQDVEAHQDNVRWHLETLARLNLERELAGPPRPDRRPHDGWDPAWAQPAIWGRHEVIWLEATSHYGARIPTYMDDYPTFEAAAADPRVQRWKSPANREAIERWWPAAHASARRMEIEDPPFIWIPYADWAGHWHQFVMDKSAPHGRLPSGPLHVDWHGLVDLQRRLITPYVQRAAAHDVVIGQRGSADAASSDESAPEANLGPVRVEQRRVWRSLLAPVYLQLLEGLRRVSDGQSGATWCRECGQPFLTLDARRSSFCNDRERFRFAQRERRRRLGGKVIDFPLGPPT